MNAAAPPDLIDVTDYHDGSDSDTSIDDADEYYQPVSAVDSDDDDDDPTHPPQLLSNGAGATVSEVQRGISDLRLNGHVVDRDVSSDDDDEEEEEEEAAEDAESAMARAVREDESRRRAAMTAENRARVLEAMQGVSFAGAPPSWAGRVSGEALVARLRALESSTRN